MRCPVLVILTPVLPPDTPTCLLECLFPLFLVNFCFFFQSQLNHQFFREAFPNFLHSFNVSIMGSSGRLTSCLRHLSQMSFPLVYIIIWLISLNSTRKETGLDFICHLFPGTRTAFSQSKYSRNTWNKMLMTNDLCLNLHVYSQITEQPRRALQSHSKVSHSNYTALHWEIIFN